ncbi:MAG: ABC transporter ATP-binding protein [Lachnospiraceae bacterium]|nr:ABC transporter ATP-binding protein [Lachnospiraceae bacterium]
MDSSVQAVIQVKNLYKIFRVGEEKVRALNGVDLTIRRGEFCAIVGTSGSGKSTMLNMLAGLEKPTKAEVIIAVEHLERMSENELVHFRREKVGFIFQSFNLLPTMNAVENVALPLTFRGVDKKTREAKAEKMLKLVGLSTHVKHRPTEMSGGQQQRVGVARALVLDSEIIFADEPTGNLDSRTSEEVLGLMRRVVQENRQTMVMVTHDRHLAGFADRIFHIIDGKIVKIEEQQEYREDGK